MSDLDATIREQLEEFCSDWCAEAGKAAILGALDIHKRNGPGCCTECWESGPGYEGEPVPYPCPTVKAIANGLGIET